MYCKKVLFLIFCLPLLLTIFSKTAYSKPKIWAGDSDYAPGKVVTVIGTDFGANMTLTIKITRPGGSVVIGDGSFSPGSDTVTTDPKGSLIYQYTLNGIVGRYLIEAIFNANGTDIVIATGAFDDDGGDIHTTDSNGEYGVETGYKVHYKKGEAIWVVGKFAPSTVLSWKIKHGNHIPASGFVTTDANGYISPNPTMIWDIPVDFVTHFDPNEGDDEEEEEKGKYKLEIYSLKKKKWKSAAHTKITISDVIDEYPDHGDAADPLYPSLHIHNGGWHLNIRKEWIGPNVDGEIDSRQPNLDSFDDGVGFFSISNPNTPTVFLPNTPTEVRVTVNTSGLGASRYDNSDLDTLLFLNAWADWNGDGDWDDNGEKIIGTGSPTGRVTIDPTTFGGSSYTFNFTVTPPAIISDLFYSRFRLDRGQDGGNLFVGDGLEQTRGKAFWGEVEDYKNEMLDPINIIETTIPKGNVNSAYNYTLTTEFSVGTKIWSLLSGTLPDGINLNASTGEITGTPTTEGIANFTIQVTDSSLPNPESASQAFTFTIAPPLVNVSILNMAIPNGTVNAFFSHTLTSINGNGANTWSIVGGAMPDGLTIDGQTGIISGTLTTQGISNFTIQVVDSSQPTNLSASQVFTMTVDNPTITVNISDTNLPNGNVNTFFTHTLSSINGIVPNTWSIITGTIPDGLTLDGQTGVISGIPTTQGGTSFTVQVMDSSTPTPMSDSQPLTLAIDSPLVNVTILESTIPVGTANSFYSSTLTTSSGLGTNTWSVVSGALPAGLSLNLTAGSISGTPTTPETYNFTIQVADSAIPTNTIDTQTFSMVVNEPFVSTLAGIQNAPLDIYYYYLPTITGGVPSYIWSISSGSLPPGFFLDFNTGALYGTPTSVGTFNFTYQVVDQNLNIITQPVIFTVLPPIVSLEYSIDPGYGINDGVEPDGGDTSGIYIFKVIYKNSSNRPPTDIAVFINGGLYTLSPVTPCVGACDFIAGVTYIYYAILIPGNYNYYFYASDNGLSTDRLPASTELSNLIITSSGTLPTLLYSQETGYGGTDGLNPEVGDNVTLFTYKVIYEDPDNFDPSMIQVFFDGNTQGNNMTLDTGAAQILRNGDKTDGEQYKYTTTMNPGDHTYYFSATDNEGNSVDLPAQLLLAGPTVSGFSIESSTGTNVTPGNNTTLNFTAFNTASCGVNVPQLNVINSNTGSQPPTGYVTGENAYYDIIDSSCATWNVVDIFIYYTQAQILTDKTTLRIFHDPLGDGNWVDSTISHDTVHNIIRARVTSLSPFVIATTAPPTVVSIYSFTGIGQGNDILLKWETASEVDNFGFNIWRSSKENDEYVIVNDLLISGKGNQLSGASYFFIDKSPSSNIIYYRLQDIDSGGKGRFYDKIIKINKTNHSGSYNYVGQTIASDLPKSSENKRIVKPKDFNEIESKNSSCFINQLSY